MDQSASRQHGNSIGDNNNTNNHIVTWKKINNYVTTSLEEFIEYNASQQESKINKVSEQQQHTNIKNTNNNSSNKGAVTARVSSKPSKIKK